MLNLCKYQVLCLPFRLKQDWQSKQWVIIDDWNKESNWTDFGASNGESVGNTINVNALCKDVEYTLSTAIKAIIDLEQESGVAYIKSGIVVTFKTAESDTNGAPVLACLSIYTRSKRCKPG